MSIDKIFMVGLMLLTVTAASCTMSSSNGQPLHSDKVEVYIEGSDIETPENTATRNLRDALEAKIAARVDVSLAQAGQGNIAVLIPELVTLSYDSRPPTVTFRARLTLKSPEQTKDLSGSCSTATIAVCAERILQGVLQLRRRDPRDKDLR